MLDAAALAGSCAAGAPSDLRALLLSFVPGAEIPPMADADALASPLAAEVNHGIWIAACPCGAPGDPAPGCIVWLADPWAWCVRCGNAEVGGRWRPVALPADSYEIEALLELRPDPATRNWVPGETAAELLRQNAEHGVEHDI